MSGIQYNSATGRAWAGGTPDPSLPAEPSRIPLFSRLLLGTDLEAQLLLGARLVSEESRRPNSMFELLTFPGPLADTNAAAKYFFDFLEHTMQQVTTQYADMEREAELFERASVIPTHLKKDFLGRQKLFHDGIQTLNFVHPGIDAITSSWVPRRQDGSFDFPEDEKEYLGVMMHWLSRQVDPCTFEQIADVKSYLVHMLFEDEVRREEREQELRQEQEMQRRLGGLSLETDRPGSQQRNDLDALVSGLDQLNITIPTETEAQLAVRQQLISDLRQLLRSIQQMVRDKLGLPHLAPPEDDDIGGTALLEEILVEHEQHGGDRLQLLVDIMDMIKTSGVLAGPGDEDEAEDEEEDATMSEDSENGSE